MILLLSVTEADCLDRQHRRVIGATNNYQRRRSAYRASGFVPRLSAVGRIQLANVDGVSKLTFDCRDAGRMLDAVTGHPSARLMPSELTSAARPR
jgi:hypothetical protein